MKTKVFAAPLLALSLALAGAPAVLALQGPPPPPGWDAMPPQYRSEVEQHGFRDGIEQAQADWEHHRRPTPMNGDKYRSPDLPRDQWPIFRRAFRKGYSVAMRRYTGRPGRY